MSFPSHNFKRDSFGPIADFLPREPETEGQKRINRAWRKLKFELTNLEELVNGIRLRGIYSDEAIKWFTEEDQLGKMFMADNLTLLGAKVGDAVDELRNALVEVGKARRLVVDNPNRKM